MKEIRVMCPTPSSTRPAPAASDPHDGERGQLLVVFALAMVAFVAMVGLIIDGGDTALQKRDQQNVADAAAMAAGYAHINGQNEVLAARAVAAANGYTHGANNTIVTVNPSGSTIEVVVSRPHRNYFAGIVGMASWDVTATATVQSGIPNAAYGTMPIIFNLSAFMDSGNRDPDNPATFGEPASGNEDIPRGSDQFNWTVFCTAGGEGGCNASSDVVEDWIDEAGISTTVTLDDTIAPLNAGSHTTLYDAAAGVVGEGFPVAIVDDTGDLVGWAYFHLTGSVGGSSKEISGWFETSLDAPEFKIVEGYGSGGIFGAYSVELID